MRTPIDCSREPNISIPVYARACERQPGSRARTISRLHPSAFLPARADKRSRETSHNPLPFDQSFLWGRLLKSTAHDKPGSPCQPKPPERPTRVCRLSRLTLRLLIERG